MHQVLKIIDKQKIKRELVSLRQTGIILLQKRGPNQQFKEEKRYFVDGTISKKVPTKQFDLLMDEIDGNDILADLSNALIIGDRLGDYGEIQNLFDQEKSKIVHTKGEILIIHVWASWCKSGIKYFEQTHQLLKNQKNNIRVIAVTLDDAKKDATKFFDQKSNEPYKQFHQYLTLEGWNGDHLLMTDLAVTCIPFVCIVNKYGNISYLGHPKYINLDFFINKLVKQQNQLSFIDPYENIRIKNPAYSQLLTLKKFSQKFKNSQYLCIKALQNYSCEKKLILQMIEFDAFFYEGDEDTRERLKQFGPQSQKIRMHPIKCRQISQKKPKCQECKKDLTFPYHWLVEQQGSKFRCSECLYKQDNVYKKKTVYLCGKWSNKFSCKLLGDEIYPKENQGKFEEPKCIGCSCKIIDADITIYTCLGCKVDPCYEKDKQISFCQKCFKQYQSGNKNKTVKDKLQKQNHQSIHPFVRFFKEQRIKNEQINQGQGRQVENDE